MTTVIKNWAIPAVILLILVTFPFYTSGYILSLLLIVFMYAALAVSWIIFSGYTGYINLGVAAFFGLGTYVAVELWPRLPFPALIVLGGVVSGFFALLIGFPCLRIRGPYFIILTLGLSELVKSLVERYEVQVRHSLGTILLDTPSAEAQYYSLLGITVAAVIVAHVIRNSRFGLGLLSIKGNEDAAEVMGVNTTKYKLLSFALSAAFMGCVGTVMALRWTFIEPVIAFNPLITFQVTIMATLGGVEDFRGPLLGAALLTLISEVLGLQFVYHYLIILGTTLILVIRFLPSGIMGTLRRLRMGRRNVAQYKKFKEEKLPH